MHAPAFALALLLALPVAGAAPPAGPPLRPGPPDPSAPLADLLADPVALAALAVQAHPDVAAASARVAGLQSMAEVAGAFPDPMLDLESMHAFPGPEVDEHMTGLGLMLRQELPLPGVQRARREAAQAELQGAEAERDEVVAMLRAEVHAAYWRLSLVRARRAVDEEHLSRLAELEEVVRSRYETGEAGASALLRVALLRDQLDLDRRELDVAEAALLAELARATARAQVRVATPPPTEVPVQGEPAAWLERAASQRPAVRAALAEAQVAQAQAGLARAEARIMPTVSAGYETAMMPGAGDVVSVGLSLPLGISAARVGRGMQAAAEQETVAAQAMSQALLDAIRAELVDAHAAWARAVDRGLVTRDQLVPRARQALDATLADYRVGRAPFAELVDAELMLLDLERARLEAAADTRLQQARVAGLLGVAPEEL